MSAAPQSMKPNAGVVSREVRLRRRPRGAPTPEDFDIAAVDLEPLKSGEVLVETIWLSIDPTHRVWMSDRPQYMEPIALGEVVRGFGVGRVAESRSSTLKAGTLVAGLLGWRSHCVVSPGAGPELFPLPADPPFSASAFLSACGASGVAAYHGLVELARIQPGECVVVSSAAGAVGSLVGQIAKLKGCRVVGLAGGEPKRRWALELGFDAVVDHSREGWIDELAAAIPDGADVSFENVGGEIMDAVLRRMKVGGRVALCGMIARYNDEGEMRGDFGPVLMRRLTVRGFQISDLDAQAWRAAQVQLFQWLAEGRLKYSEIVIEGLDQAPRALAEMLAGRHRGKVVVLAGSPPDRPRALPGGV